MPTDVNILMEEGKCYACVGASDAEIIKLSLMSRTLIALAPESDTSVNALMEYSKCYACYGFTGVELLELSLLDQIAQAMSI